MTKNKEKINNKIGKIEITDDKITGRGGLFLFVRYITGIKILDVFEEHFGFIRKSRKGQSIKNICKQILCCFFDGTDFVLTRFDKLLNDEGYKSIIETEDKQTLSPHSIKRFQRFQANASFYYMMVIGFNLFESFKYDVTNDVISIRSLAKTFRRLLVDFAVKIVNHANQIIVKVNRVISEQIQINKLWERCNNPPFIIAV